MSPDIYVLIEHVNGKTLDISYVMLAQARQLAQQTGGKVNALLLGHNVAELASDLEADAIFYVDHRLLADFNWGNCMAVVEQVITAHAPRLFLFGDTTIGSGIAGGLSAKLNLPLVSHCKQLDLVDGKLVYTGQICGGKILAEGEIPEITTLICMVPGAFKVEAGKSSQRRQVETTPIQIAEDEFVKNCQRTQMKNYIQPEAGDVDITRQKVLIGVGRGIQSEDNLELAQELADIMEGAVCASRPIIDQNWLPTSRLVGKSGKTIKPKVYLAFGISGAPEHLEAATGSETIVAVNTDPSAPIFNQAQYGIEMDVLDLLPALIERVKAEK